jgi:Carboxypeptidase regulatory-like domain/TonB dependent receptor
MFRSVLTCFRFAIFCVVGSLACALPAAAGTTGTLTGTVIDQTTHKPIAGAMVSVSSPSQVAKATTDAGGRFVLISLAPDTYTVGVSKEGYDSYSTTGVSVFADQSQALELPIQRSLRQIGRVTSRSPLDVVKPGTTTDVYSVDSATTAAAAPAGGGGSLNSAYSAIAVIPGAFVPPNQMGVNQTVYIRGGYYDQIGYEYDGVPVNRSFDNYPGHSASTLGQQELQVYTGGGGAGASASGLAGFINQVVKSGTFPGYEDFSVRIAGPTYYHDLSGEIAGATTNRNFTYYVGVSGYNQAYRYFDNANGADLINIFPNTGPSNKTTFLDFYPAVYPTCNKNLSSPFDTGQIKPPNFAYDLGCYAAMNPVYANDSFIADRETIGNFHFKIPHRNGTSDDIQFLYTNSSVYTQYYSGVGDAGYETVYNDTVGGAEWPDYLTYPAGTKFGQLADIKPVAYYFPGSPTGRCANVDILAIKLSDACPLDDPSILPNDYRDARWDTASIGKLQYQKNLGDKAYLRAFGYTFYSNTNRSGASRRGIGSGFGATNYDYEVDTHTRGGELQFGDQIGDRNLLTGWANYVTASTDRLNNYIYLNQSYTPVSNLTNGSECFSAFSGEPGPCNGVNTQGTFAHPSLGENVTCSGGLGKPIPGPACAAGASWRITYTGTQGAINTVVPKFAATALNDEWRPTDKLDINAGLRLERDEYDLADTDTPGKNFWFAAAQKEFCYDPTTFLPVLVPQPPQDISNAIPFVGLNCPQPKFTGNVQTVHPDGLNGHLLLSNVYNPTIVQTYLEPRIGATYTLSPNTVLRASAGRYVQQPQAYEVQYNTNEENLAAQLMGFLPYGYTTPRHDSYPQYSNNFDLSLEHRFTGTDISVKLTPYFRYATNQLYGVEAADLSASLNTGIERSQGVEFELVKGSFERDGFAALFSYTYLSSKEKFANFPGSTNNPVDLYNDEISAFNLLTKAGGGAKCYADSADVTPAPNCELRSIRNPYYGMPLQPLFDRNGWYDTGLDFPYLSPNTFAFVLNYKHRKFAIAPVATLNEGASYGNPSDVIGVDPRTCLSNNFQQGFVNGDPLHADYTSCNFAATQSGELFVPNPETGHFDRFGEFRQPWQFNMGMQMSYEFAPKVKANLTFANLFNQCFGGSSTPWSAAYPASSQICAYQSNIFYVNNFYNGSGPHDLASNGVPLNPYFAHSFVPSYADINTFNYTMPLNVYLQFSVKL